MKKNVTTIDILVKNCVRFTMGCMAGKHNLKYSKKEVDKFSKTIAEEFKKHTSTMELTKQ